MDYANLVKIVENKVAIRTIHKLYSAGGPNSKVFPPTYLGGVYAAEERLIDGTKTPCVLLDSVASQANRMEEALQRAIDSNKINLPMVEIHFSNENDLDIVGNRITTLQAPHRISDALFRECTLNGESFRDSKLGKKIFESTPYNAVSLFKTCPTALLFGMWDSAGPKGGNGNKFERGITSEIVGINTVFGVGTSSRIDPVITTTSDTPVYETENGGWTLEEKDAKKENGKPKKYKKNGKLSEVNLGNIAPSISTYDDYNSIPNPLSGNPKTIKGDVKANGVTMDYAEQTCVISLAGLRKLYFPINDDKSIDRDNAARTVLTALGLVSFTLSVENGLDLRSRCVLTQKEPAVWDVLGGADETFTLDSKTAIDLLNESVENAKKKDLSFEDPITLSPNSTLVKAIKNSQIITEKKSKED